jgi:hypothetical protein
VAGNSQSEAGGAMRLRPEKIDQLAKVITDALAANPEVKLAEKPDHLIVLIRSVITADMKAEDEIEEAARKLLDAHMDEIQKKGAQYDKLLQKAKQQLAKDRKFVL